jgi:hypothetical protein
LNVLKIISGAVLEGNGDRSRGIGPGERKGFSSRDVIEYRVGEFDGTGKTSEGCCGEEGCGELHFDVVVSEVGSCGMNVLLVLKVVVDFIRTND